MNKTIGERILYFCKQKNISQKKLAELTNTTETTMSRYINGSRQPKIEKLINIANVLNISIDELTNANSEKNNLNFPEIRNIIARNAKDISFLEKKELINILLSQEDI